VFDINRSDVRSPTFGAGIHYCLGAALARAEMEETLRFLVERFERLSLSDTPRWMPFHHIRCFEPPVWLTVEGNV